MKQLFYVLIIEGGGRVDNEETSEVGKEVPRRFAFAYFWRCFLATIHISDAPLKLKRPHLRSQMFRKLALMKEGGRSKTGVSGNSRFLPFPGIPFP